MTAPTKLLNRYEILRKIASGGMATVYLARDTALGRDVAVKSIHPHLLSNPSMLRRFENEARAIASLSHENVIKLFDYSSDSENHFLVIEYVDGFTLQQVLEANGTIPNLVLLEVAAQILAGLAAAHQHGIYHRDVKPSNIMLDGSGLVRIMDFGIAHLVHEESLTTTGTFVGSPNYISPEQASGGKITCTSDVFSAGSVLYECATGHCPFSEETVHATILAIIEKEPAPAAQRNPRALQSISDLIGASMQKDAGGRPDTVALIERVEKLCHDEGWQLGKKRLAQFMADPQAYRKDEDRELHQHFRKKALAIAARQPVSALKSFSQAEAFGPLESSDRKAISAIRAGAARRRVLGAVAVLALVVGIAIVFYKQTARVPAIEGPVATVPKLPDTAAAPRVPVGGPAPDTQSTPGPMTVSRTDLNSAGPVTTGLVSPVRRTPKPVAVAALPALPAAPSGPGYLRVRTNPPWASVFVDSFPVGSTPVLLPLSSGTHLVTLRKEGCLDHREEVKILPGDTLVREVVLNRAR